MTGYPPTPGAPAPDDEASRPLDARELVRAKRREALLAAAEGVFAESGFAGAKMADIAARAGYSAGNLYNVFASKEALFGELLETRGSELLARLEEAIGTDHGPRAGLARLIDAVLAGVEQHRAFFVMLTTVAPNLEWAGPREEGRALRERLERLFLRWIERGLRAGELPPGEPAAYACVVQGSLNRYVARWVQQDGDAAALRAGAPGLCTVLTRALGVAS